MHGREHINNKGDEKLKEKSECGLSGIGCNPCYENRIGYQIKALDHMLRRNAEAFIRENGFDGMSMINGFIIGYLAENEGTDIFQKDIEKKFKIGKSSIAGTLKTMEEKGYIVRQSVPGDTRLKRVCLTDKARTYIKKIEQGHIQIEEKLCQGLSDEEIQTFLNIVRKMQDNMSE